MEDSWDIPWNIDPPEISSMAGNPWTFPANEMIQGSVFAMILLVKMAIPRLRSLVEGSLEPSSQIRDEKLHAVGRVAKHISKSTRTEDHQIREEKLLEERRCRCAKR